AAVASALAFALFARFERPFVALGFVGLVPWLMALDRTSTIGGALAARLLMSAAFTLAVFGWVADAGRSYTGLPQAGGLALLFVLAPLLEPQIVVHALVRVLARRGSAPPGAVGVLASALAWVGVEWASPKLFGDSLGHGLYPSALLRQAA